MESNVMNKSILVVIWLTIPALLLAYHYGPGQAELARDTARTCMEEARAAEMAGDWRVAMDAYAAALGALPPGEVTQRDRVRLAKAKARMYTGELVEAITDMENLLTDVEDHGLSAEAQNEVRANLATAQYYAAWLMRLEGAQEDEWTLPADQARQHFRFLSEVAYEEGSPASQRYQENLEATIRLARLDLSDLEGLPLPKFCQGCKNVSQKCRSQRKSKIAKKQEGEKKEDARKAGFSERPQGGS